MKQGQRKPRGRKPKAKKSTAKMGGFWGALASSLGGRGKRGGWGWTRGLAASLGGR